MDEKKLEKIINYINKTGLTVKEIMILVVSLKETYKEQVDEFIKKEIEENGKL